MGTCWAHGGRVAVRFRIRGKTYATTLPIDPTKTGIAAARRQCKEAEHRLRAGERWDTVRADLRGEQRPVAVGTLGYYAQHVLDHADVERSTLLEYERIWNRYWRRYDRTPIDALLRSELENHLANFSVGKKTRKNAVSFLRLAFEVAKKDKVIKEAPTDDWQHHVKVGKTKDPDPYTETERDAILAAIADPMAHCYFTLAFHSGMRTGEMLGLEWAALDKPYVQVAQTLVRRRLKPYTKTGDQRRVVLPPIAWDTLARNPTKFRRGLVFLSPEGHPFLDADWMMRHWAKAHSVAKIRMHRAPYPWRSTYISLALSAGVALLWVSKQTGHDIKTMEKHYARWIEGREDADAAELAKVYLLTGSVDSSR